jgi:hypothetical protein
MAASGGDSPSAGDGGKAVKRVVALAILAAGCAAAPARSSAAVIVVDCMGSGFTTIQAGADAAATGDTILIAPCIYHEQVSVVDKALTLQGSGTDVTQLIWAGGGAALDIVMPEWGRFTILDLRITRQPESATAVHWDEHGMALRNCVIAGGVGGGMYYGEAHVDNCTITRLGVSGLVRQTVIADSRIGRLSIGGVQFEGGNALASTRTRYGELTLGCLMYASCTEDSIGRVEVPGGLDCWSSFHAEETTIDTLVGMWSPEVALDRCVVGGIVYTYVWEDDPVSLSVRHCLVRGSLLVESAWGQKASVAPEISGARDFYGLRLVHNTILGDLSYPLDVWFNWPADAHWVRDNVIMGRTEIFGGDLLVVSHNDFAGGFDVTAPGDSVFANFSEDPLFCDPGAGDYTLQECSPCLGASHDGGDVGALGVGCICQVNVEPASWGAIKGIFRRRPSN